MGNSASLTEEEKNANHVIIVGGGYGGMILGMKLLNNCKLTIIDPKDSFFHSIGSLRSCVEPTYAKKIFAPYAESFGDSFVRGKVISIDEKANSVTLEDGKVIQYTQLVIATGTQSPFPSKVSRDHINVTRTDGLKLYSSINEEIVKSNNIVCVGGGAVGIELSGEIKTEFPRKNITLIHSTGVICSPRLNDKAQNMLQDQVQKKGIILLLNEKVSNLTKIQFNTYMEGQMLKTTSGKDIAADLVFDCTGTKFSSDAFKSALSDHMTDTGQLRVDEFLRVEGTDNIFAIGDIANIDQEKTAYNAEDHANLVAENLIANIRKQNMKAYSSRQFVIIIPLGRDGGVSQFKGLVFGDTMTKNIKAKHLFTSKYWDLMKQKVPT